MAQPVVVSLVCSTLVFIHFGFECGYIRNLHTNQPTGEHFNLPGPELYHLKVSVLEKVWNLGRSLLKVREYKYIRDFMTQLRGMNRKKIVFI